MKVLMITRLMSGFVSSINNAEWKPMGSPAIYRMIDYLDKNKTIDILFTLKASELIDKKLLNCKLSINGLLVRPMILPGPSVFPKLFGPLRTYLSEFYQCWRAYHYVKKTKPDIVYIDRANVLLGAIIARFTRVSVHLRLLGTPPSLQSLLAKPALSHYLYRWAYRSPFRLVLCSRDGSPGKVWMQHALHPKTVRKRWVNGVDSVSKVRSSSATIRLVLIGRLNHLKRIDQAVKAILTLPEKYISQIHIDIIGSGELYSDIKKIIKSSDYATRFTLYGVIPHDTVLERLLNNDILISLNTHGNLTNTVLEAIRCGLCLILPEADIKTGVDIDTFTVIPKKSVIQLKKETLLEDLTKQLQRLIDRPHLIYQYQEKTRQISDSIHTWDQRIEREVRLLKPYDVIIVISDLQGGGTQKVLERLLKQWVLQKKRIAMITFDEADNDKIILPEIIDRIVLGDIGKSRNIAMGVFANLRRLYHIRRAIKQLHSPLVLSFLTSTNILTVLATRGLPCRLIISERNDLDRQSFGRIWNYLWKKCYRYADVVTANNRAVINTMTQFVRQSQCHYLPNPLVLPDNIEPIVLRKPTIVAVGRLHRQKAYDILIHAFALFYKRHPDWQLFILGEGALRAELDVQIAQLQLTEAIQLTGYLDPFPYLAAAQIYTLPSRYEGMPNALLEAMAMSIPAVISDALTGPLDFVKDHQNVLIVPVNNACALANAFIELANQPELCKNLAMNAKQSVSRFSLESVLPQWEVLFNA